MTRANEDVEHSVPSASTPRASTMWSRAVEWLKAFEAAMDTSYDDFQDRRILTLEHEVAALKTKIGTNDHD